MADKEREFKSSIKAIFGLKQKVITRGTEQMRKIQLKGQDSYQASLKCSVT